MKESIKQAKKVAKKWEDTTGLKGDCFVAYALWREMVKIIPELEDTTLRLMGKKHNDLTFQLEV